MASLGDGRPRGMPSQSIVGSSCAHVDFVIAPMRDDEYERCIEVATHAFNTNNPIMKRAGLTEATYRRYAYQSCNKANCVDTGLSLVARSETGELLAFLFLKVFDPYEKHDEDLKRQSRTIAGLFELVTGLYDNAVMESLRVGSMATGKALHCSMGGTLPDVNGKGAGKALRMRACEVARERGFNTLLVEPAHGATRHIWTKHCGGLVRAEQSSETFASKAGDYPLKGSEQSVSIVEVVLRRTRRDWEMYRAFYIAKLMVLRVFV